MKCERIQELILTDYSDGELKGKPLHELEAHLAQCTSCQQLAHNVRRNDQLLKSQPTQSPDPFIWQRIKRRLEEESDPALGVSTWDILKNYMRMFKPAVVTVCAFVILGVTLISTYHPPVYQSANGNKSKGGSYLAYVMGPDSQPGDEVSQEIEEYFL